MPPSAKMSPSSAQTELRELRNMTVGHPTAYKRRDQSGTQQQVLISRITISNTGFQYQVWDETMSNPSSVDGDLPTLYQGYKREAQTVLGDILESLRRR